MINIIQVSFLRIISGNIFLIIRNALHYDLKIGKHEAIDRLIENISDRNRNIDLEKLRQDVNQAKNSSPIHFKRERPEEGNYSSPNFENNKYELMIQEIKNHFAQKG